MKTKTILGIGALALAATLATPARADIGFSLNLGIPFPPPLAIRLPAPPFIPAPAVFIPAPVCAPPVVVVRPAVLIPRPVIYARPGYYGHSDGRRDWDRDRRDRRDHDRGRGGRGDRR